MTKLQHALSIEARWADRTQGRWVVGQGRLERLVVGTAQLPLSDSRLPEEGLSFASADGSVQLVAGMRARLHGPQGVQELGALVTSGRVASEGGALRLELERGERLETELGGLIFEVARIPALGLAARGAPSEGLLRTANIALVLLLVAGLFAVEASTREGITDDDEPQRGEARVAKYLTVPAPKPPPAPAKPERVASTAPVAASHRLSRDGKAGQRSPSPATRAVLPSLGGVLQGVGAAGLGGELSAALGNLRAAGPRAGLGGLGLRSALAGGPGGELIGLGGLQRRSIAGSGPALRKGPAEPLPQIVSEVIGCDAGGCLTRELIRKVIAAHRDQLRYCYESLLNRYPDLGGKVAVKFLIRPAGEVARAEVADSSAHNPQLEECLAQRVRGWVFPAAKNPTQVSYPFVFHRSGG